MKKSLLLGAFAIMGLAASAQNASDYYKVYYGGQELENGAQIVCTHADTSVPGEYNFRAEINVVNLAGYAMPIVTEILDNDNTADGFAQVCFGGAGANGQDANCLTTPPFQAMLPGSNLDSFVWQYDVNTTLEETTYTYAIYVGEGDLEDYDLLEDSKFEFSVNFKYDPDNAAIAGIEIDPNQPVEYYNLLGQKVNNPSKGVYIVKQGKKAFKKVFGK